MSVPGHQNALAAILHGVQERRVHCGVQILFDLEWFVGLDKKRPTGLKGANHPAVPDYCWFPGRRGPVL